MREVGLIIFAGSRRNVFLFCFMLCLLKMNKYNRIELFWEPLKDGLLSRPQCARSARSRARSARSRARSLTAGMPAVPNLDICQSKGGGRGAGAVPGHASNCLSS